MSYDLSVSQVRSPGIPSSGICLGLEAGLSFKKNVSDLAKNQIRAISESK
jgi:hypothetical protein